MKILRRYWPSMVTLAAVLWLTLAPQPLPDLDVPPFDGLDKVMHAVMMGGLAGAFMFDWRRGGRWNLRKSNAGRQHMLTPRRGNCYMSVHGRILGRGRMGARRLEHGPHFRCLRLDSRHCRHCRGSTDSPRRHQCAA